MNCAFIGFGNAASAMARGLLRNGLEHVFFYTRPTRPEKSALQTRRAAESGAIRLAAPAELPAASSTVLSCVVGSAALEVAEQVVPLLSPNHLYVDLNTTAPKVKQAIADLAAKNGVAFADAAILGPVEVHEHRTPITACGDGARLFRDRLTPYGMNITALDAPAGSAATLKLLRSIFQKGLACLLLEALQAARVWNVEEALLDSLQTTFDGTPLRTVARRMVPKAVANAERMAHEMREVQAFLAEKNLPSRMSRAAEQTLEACTKKDNTGPEA